MKATLKLLIAGIVLAALLSACGGGGGPQTVKYTLVTKMDGAQMVMVGSGGSIEGVTNPTLRANVGDTVEITLTSGDGVEHDIALTDFNVISERILGVGSSTTITFVADKSGTFIYNCTIPGHIDAGMKGQIIIAEAGQ